MGAEQAPKPALREYFAKSERFLIAQFDTSGVQISATNKGDNREAFCKQFLEGILPPYLRLWQSGELVDSDGRGTDQMDVLVVRETAPALGFHGANRTFLVEGVLAVIEVKSDLDRSELKNCLAKFHRVKALRGRIGAGTVAIGGLGEDMYPDENGRRRTRPLRIVFAYKGATWKTLRDELAENEPGLVDLVCILQRGVLVAPNMFLRSETSGPYGLNEEEASCLELLWFYLTTYAAAYVNYVIDVRPYIGLPKSARRGD